MRVWIHLSVVVLVVIWGAAALAAKSAKQPAAPAPSKEARIYVDVKVNGQPARFVLDTGAEGIALFRPAAKRLKLTVAAPPANLRPGPGELDFGITHCEISIGETKWTRDWGVLDLPKGIDMAGVDGVVGWPVMRENLLHLGMDGNELKISALPKPPADIQQWRKFDLVKKAGVLAFNAPTPGGKDITIFIDTGDSGGVILCEEQWKQWRRAHADAPTTLEAYWTPAQGQGMVVSEVCWAQDLTIGSFAIKGVPVTHSKLLGSGPLGAYQASLGLFAVAGLDIISDWTNGCFYVRPASKPQLVFAYNRIGAVFVPRGRNGKDLVAKVIDKSPAYKAGIRNGDILLDVRKAGDPGTGEVQIESLFEQPAGTKLRLMLKRNGKTFKATVELQDILAP